MMVKNSGKENKSSPIAFSVPPIKLKNSRRPEMA